MIKYCTQKIIISFCLLLLSMSLLKAQNLQTSTVNIINNLSHPSMSYNHTSRLGKTGSCGVDTLYYTYNKTTAFNAISLNASTSGNAFAQWYPAPNAITVAGFDFFAWQSSTTFDHN